MTKETITKKFLIENDGDLVWMTDSYLLMRAMETRKEILDILNQTAELKTKMREAGHIFTS